MKPKQLDLWVTALTQTILDNLAVQPPLPGMLDIPPQVQAIPGRGSARQGASPPAPRGKPPPDSVPLEGQPPPPLKGVLP